MSLDYCAQVHLPQAFPSFICSPAPPHRTPPSPPLNRAEIVPGRGLLGPIKGSYTEKVLITQTPVPHSLQEEMRYAT